jgi:outer membrane protein TolC
MIAAASLLNAQEVMTVKDAVKIGLKNNYDIQIAKNNVDIAENNTTLGTAGFLPTLDATGNANLTRTDQETNSPFSFGTSTTENYSGSVALNWTLFDGFRMFTSLSKYKELKKQTEYSSRNRIEQSVVNIERAYFDLVQKERLLEVAKQSLEVSRVRFEKTAAKRELGGASSTDALNAQVAVNNDSSLVLNRKLDVEVAKKDLNILLGREPSAPVNVDSEITIPNFTLSRESVAESAKKNNAGLLAAKQQKVIADQNISIANSALYPRLSMNASYGYSDRTTSTNSDRFDGDIETQSTDASVGLTLSFNIFNGFRDDVNRQNAKVDYKNAQLRLQKEIKRVEGLVDEKYTAYENSLEALKLQQANTKVAKQNLELQKERYQTGAATSLEFRDAQTNYIQAQSNLISAKFRARMAYIELQKLIGNLKL